MSLQTLVSRRAVTQLAYFKHETLKTVSKLKLKAVLAKNAVRFSRTFEEYILRWTVILGLC